MKKIGLIAGNRRFPLIFSESAREKGYSVVAVAIKKDTSAALKKLVDKICWVGLGDFKRMFAFFKAEGVTDIVMAGQISPRRLFSKEAQQSKEIRDLLSVAKDKRADSIFSVIAGEIKERGFNLLDSTLLLAEHLPKKGLLTRREPEACVSEDIKFGFEIAKAIAGLDIGQTVAVKDKAIVGIEAFEGTDNLIRRSGKLCGRGFTIVKVSKPSQDMRFDIPVVGLNTVKALARAGAKCLAFESGKTLFIDRDKAVALADKKGLVITAV